MNEKETIRMLNEMPKTEEHLHLILKMCYTFGKHLSEVRDLRWKDVDLEGGWITFNSESKKKQTFTLIGYRDSTMSHLQIRRELEGIQSESRKNEFVFLDFFPSTEALEVRLRRYLKKNCVAVSNDLFGHGDFSFTAQSLRKCRGLHLLNRGLDFNYISKLYNHSDKYSTMVYLGIKSTDFPIDLNLVVSYF